MKDNIMFPWRKIVFSSVLSVFAIFILGFIDALLCCYYVITLKTAEILMLPAVFLGNFIGCICVSYEKKSIMYSMLSSCLTFMIMNGTGIFTNYSLNTDYTITVFIILGVSAVLCCVIKAMMK